ncbi:hypothetical protein DITRI_Ditri01bG0038300 [Diplodiscus trichospermus]
MEGSDCGQIWWRQILFWSCERINGGVILKHSFPRIYALAINKHGKVKEFGQFVNNQWTWSISLRTLYGWELQQWEELNKLIGNFHVTEKIEDRLVWKEATSGDYSVKQFCIDHINAFAPRQTTWKKVWSGLVPTKVEVFFWQVVLGKIAVKEQLAMRGLLNGSNIDCTLCGREIESANHLFFTCQMMNRPLTSWIPPPQKAVKFNVDGASKGKPGSAGIGGILRDHMGVEKIRFSKFIGVAD